MLLHIPPVCPSAFEVPSLVMGVQYDIRVLLRNANDVGYRDVGTSKNPGRANSEPPTLKHPSIGAKTDKLFLLVSLHFSLSLKPL